MDNALELEAEVLDLRERLKNIVKLLDDPSVHGDGLTLRQRARIGEALDIAEKLRSADGNIKPGPIPDKVEAPPAGVTIEPGTYTSGPLKPEASKGPFVQRMRSPVGDVEIKGPSSDWGWRCASCLNPVAEWVSRDEELRVWHRIGHETRAELAKAIVERDKAREMLRVCGERHNEALVKLEKVREVVLRCINAESGEIRENSRR